MCSSNILAVCGHNVGQVCEIDHILDKCVRFVLKTEFS